MKTPSTKSIATRLPMSDYLSIQKAAIVLKMSMSEYICYKLFLEDNSKVIAEYEIRVQEMERKLRIANARIEAIKIMNSLKL